MRWEVTREGAKSDLCGWSSEVRRSAAWKRRYPKPPRIHVVQVIFNGDFQKNTIQHRHNHSDLKNTDFIPSLYVHAWKSSSSAVAAGAEEKSVRKSRVRSRSAR